MKNYLKPGSKSIKNINLVNRPYLGTFMLRVGLRSANGLLHYGAMSECIKHSNYNRMLNFELFMIDNAPDSVREFVLQNEMLAKETKTMMI